MGAGSPADRRKYKGIFYEYSYITYITYYMYEKKRTLEEMEKMMSLRRASPAVS
jgi:hypothetical protein